MSLAERLKELRSQKQLSQRELARLLNLHFSTIGLYETGRREPDYETLEKMAEFFNVSIGYLLGKEDDQYKKWFESLQDKERIEYLLATMPSEFTEAIGKLKTKTPEEQQRIIKIWMDMLNL